MKKYVLKSDNNIILEETNKKRIEEAKRKIEISLFLGVPYKNINFKITPFGKFPDLEIEEIIK